MAPAIGHDSTWTNAPDERSENTIVPLPLPHFASPRTAEASSRTLAAARRAGRLLRGLESAAHRAHPRRRQSAGPLQLIGIRSGQRERGGPGELRLILHVQI